MPRRKVQANEIPAKLPDKDKDKSKRKQKSEEYLKYQRYIRSKEWDEIKKIILERDNYKCQFCGWTPDDYDPNLKSTHRTLTVHHKTYEHLYDELNHLDDLIVLDNICHSACHKSPSNFKHFKMKKYENE